MQQVGMQRKQTVSIQEQARQSQILAAQQEQIRQAQLLKQAQLAQKSQAAAAAAAAQAQQTVPTAPPRKPVPEPKNEVGESLNRFRFSRHCCLLGLYR